MAPTKKNSYPHLEGIKDLSTQRTIKLLWDKAFGHDTQVSDLQAQLKAAQATIDGHVSTISSMQTDINRISIANSTAGVAKGGKLVPPGAPSTGGSGGSSGGTDDGLGAQGCTQAGSTGHVTAGTPLTAVTAGQIVCGTANEFSSLLAPVVDQATRDANALELLERMIWHLQLAGFTAGRQRNPSGVLSTDKLTVQIDGVMRAYDVMSLTDYTLPLTSHMVQVFPASYVVDGGTPD